MNSPTFALVHTDHDAPRERTAPHALEMRAQRLAPFVTPPAAVVPGPYAVPASLRFMGRLNPTAQANARDYIASMDDATLTQYMDVFNRLTWTKSDDGWAQTEIYKMILRYNTHTGTITLRHRSNVHAADSWAQVHAYIMATHW